MMQPVASVAQSLASAGLGFDRVQVMHGGSFKQSRTVVIAPTRGMIHHRTVAAWQSLIAPMNQARAFLMCSGDEVGQAYNRMIQNILADPVLSTWDYVLTLEDDNLPPPDAHIRLLESIEGFDAVSGLYFTKGDWNAPMAYGDPAAYRSTGVLDFMPFSPERVRHHLTTGTVAEVNGIAMGCALWRMDLFRKVPAPWFVTVADVIDGSARAYTQDLSFCEKAVRQGCRFAVDFRVKVGHMDIKTGEVY
jgi:hypothetical protein